MMGRMKGWMWIGLLVALAAVTGCGSTGQGNAGNQTGSIPDTISCEVYYRADPGQSFRDSILTLSTEPEQGANTASAEFDDMGFEATFLSDAGEGKSLSVAVTDLTTGEELTRGLYQFDLQAGLQDQFIGGHGFTGLAYVYHPNSAAEVQYFCRAGE